jgi:hypothetical protein
MRPVKQGKSRKLNMVGHFRRQRWENQRLMRGLWDNMIILWDILAKYL